MAAEPRDTRTTGTDAYAGILGYLQAGSEAGDATSRQRLDDLTQRLAAGEDVIGNLQGKQEWAYKSKVDGSAQPFTVVVPERTTPRPWGLVVWLHGGGGTHQRDTMADIPGMLQLCVLGQGKNARYRGLSEIDVREAMDYAIEHWPVDPDRIVLSGHSLGGAGSFTLASRHPDWYAGVAPTAGWGSGAFPENLVPVRLLALSSRDDNAIHRLCRATMQAISNLGGKPTHLIVNGNGHGLVPGDLSSAFNAWLASSGRLVPPASFRYTAEDEGATGAWGVEVSVWGDAACHAAFDFNRAAGTVKLTTDNGHALLLTPARWGHPASEALILTIDGSPPLSFPAPVPNHVRVTKDADKWMVMPEEKGAAQRFHFPGGFDALLHGTRVAVVYGTQGDPAAVARRHALADYLAGLPVAAAQRDPQRMYGRLPVLADNALDDATIQTSDLVLVGSAEENTAVSRITAGFPATVTGATVTAGTETWPLTDATVGILGRNAATPSRLVYWVVSSGHEAYAVTNLPFKVLGYDTRPAVCPDLLITANGEDRLIAARRLTGRWTWCPPAEPRTALTGDWITPAGLAHLRAACLRLAVRADAGLCLSREPETGFRVYPAATAETTRIEDVAALQGAVRIMIIEPTGAELEKLLADKTIGCVMDGLDEERLESTRRYRVACIGPDSWAFLRVISDPDLPVSAMSVDVGNAIRTHAGTVLNGGK